MFLINHRLFCQGHRIKKNIVRWCFFISLFVSLQVDAQSLTLYVIPPKKPMDWRSPRHLLLSYVKSYTARTPYKKYPHPLGHIIVELADTSHYALSGMVALSTKPQMQMVWKKGYGLGVLRAVSPGKLREDHFNADDLRERFPNGDVAFIRYELSQEMFNYLWTYFEEYKSFGFDSLYNGENKPREGKGAGCSAFGVSFLEIAGLLTAAQKWAWQVEVPVQKNLLGGPLHNHRRVGVHQIVFTKKWANKNDTTAYAIRYYEPYFMYQWIQHEYHKLKQVPTLQSSTSIIQQAKGCVFNCKQQAVPNEPIWQFQHANTSVYSTKIDKNQ